MTNDAELLRRFARERDQDAFAEVVRRHAGLVYAAASRQTGGNAHLAQEVMQVVFITLAKKAAEAANQRVLVAWLYRCTRLAALQARRNEARRVAREQAAAAWEEIERGGASVPEWTRIEPVLDEAMAALCEQDRAAVLLRFFSGRTFAEIGAELGVAENAARMRTGRALEKLKDALAKRGVTTSAAVLGGALTSQAAPGVSAEYATAVAAGATAPGAAGLSGLVQVAGSFMNWKIGMTIAGVTMLIGAAGGWLAREWRGAERIAPPSEPVTVIAAGAAGTEERAALRARIAELEGKLARAETVEVMIPLTAAEVGALAGTVQRRMLKLKEKFPRAPRDTEADYDAYLFELRAILLDAVPLQAQATVAQREVGTAAGAAAFQAEVLRAALVLDEKQAASVRGLLDAAYAEFFAKNYSWAGRPPENAGEWQAARRELSARTAAAILKELSPMQQVYFRQVAGDFFMAYTSFAPASGVQY